MKKNITLLIFFTLIVLIVYVGCKSPGNGDGNVPVENNYVSFSQAVRGLITGMTNINGSLILRSSSSVSTNVPVTNGSFTITKELGLVAGTYEVSLITDEGVLLQVPSAQLGENSLYLPRTHRLIDNVIEKEEALRNYQLSVDSRQLSTVEKMLLNWQHYAHNDLLTAKKKCLKRLEKELEGSVSAAAINRLSKTRDEIIDDIERIQSDQYNLCDAYEDCILTTSEIWLKRPTIVIYDRSVWSLTDNQWVKRPDLEGQLQYPQFVASSESYYANIAPQYLDGLMDTPFDFLKESAGDEMPDPNTVNTGEDGPLYIFFIINDDVSVASIFSGIDCRYEQTDNEVQKSWTTVPYNMLYQDKSWNTLRGMLFWSLRVSVSLLCSVPYEDESGNPSALMKLVGKIKNHRDPGHILIFENGEYIDKYGYYPQ